MKLKTIKEEFAKYMVIKDPWIIDVVMQVHVGNSFVGRDPIWTMIVAPSSGGKSTFLAPSSGIHLVHFIDDLTEKTLLSGFKIKGQESSLLKSIGSGIMVFSDFTAILSKNPQSGGEILGQLRLVYDGAFVKQTGTGKLEWTGKIGVLAASTPDVYFKLEQSRSMGERFGYYCMEQPTDEEIAIKQTELNMSSKDITAIMAPMYGEYFDKIKIWKSLHGVPELNMTKEQQQRLRQATMFSVSAKATVHTNFKTGKVDQIPNKAGVGRDNKMAEASLQTYQLMDCYEHDDPTLPVQEDRMALIEKQAYSSVNRERRKILEILAHSDFAISASKIGTLRGLGMDKESVEMYLTPLHAVGLIQKIIGNPHTWYIADENIKEFIRRVCVGIDDYIPQSNDSAPVSVKIPVMDASDTEDGVWGPAYENDTN